MTVLHVVLLCDTHTTDWIFPSHIGYSQALAIIHLGLSHIGLDIVGFGFRCRISDKDLEFVKKK